MCCRAIEDYNDTLLALREIRAAVAGGHKTLHDVQLRSLIDLFRALDRDQDGDRPLHCVLCDAAQLQAKWT